MFNGIKSIYGRSFPVAIIYMLQSTEYEALPYLKWLWRTDDFKNVMKRRTLDKTRAAKLLLLVMRLGMYGQLVTGLVLLYLGIRHIDGGTAPVGIALMVSYPIVWAHFMVIPLSFGRLFVIKPKEKKRKKETNTMLTKHSAVRIAVAGSYGKTTMKELLLSILSEGLKVAATPANKNTPSAHYSFTKKLEGKEDVLIYELGEGRPGDVAEFCKTLDPTIGFVTGLAPAHLDHYKDVNDAGKDIMTLSKHLGGDIYINAESPLLKSFIEDKNKTYSKDGCNGWKIKNVRVDFDGTHFEMSKGKRQLSLHSGLLGEHQVGPIAACVDIAVTLGLSDKQIKDGVSETAAFEHRMQPKMIAGACVIDDTYNGNIEGVRAGVELLKKLPAKRRLYVTPGLVDQGKDKEKVHLEMGKLLSKGIDQVILMQNSVTDYIKKGLEKNGFKGELVVQDDPLDFYQNLDKVVATGDVVMMQNDWTDNYK